MWECEVIAMDDCRTRVLSAKLEKMGEDNW